jgi:membrane protein
MNIFKSIRVYFNIRPDLEEKQEIVEEITRGISFRGANLWILITAIFIASLGLNVNSTAVIIGAMLISPLMGPIIGMGLAVGINDLELLKRAAKNFSVATLISVLTATIYFLISPLGEAQSELLARTSPTLYDVLIAFFGGAAGIIALSTRGGKSGNVLPGVAIATALMPPLCTAGYGIASGNLFFFLGAFYLFFINTVFISLATAIGVRMMKFPPHSFLSTDKAKKARHILTGVIIATTAPALVMTVNIIRTSIFENNVHSFVKSELSQSGTQILSSSADRQEATLRIVAVGREISDSLRKVAEGRLASYGLHGFHLTVIQGVQSDSLLANSIQKEQHLYTPASDHQKLLELSTENTALSQRLSEYTLYEEYARELRSELVILFPSVRSLSLAPIVEVQTDTTSSTRYIAVLLGLEAGKTLPAAELVKLQHWFRARVPGDSLAFITKTAHSNKQ